jgi:UDP-N-acetylglucosamine 2-epimerase (non-hydrolysing)
MTIHRPATVDSETELAKLTELITFITKDRKVVFPVHPRTTARLKASGLMDRLEGLKDLVMTAPMDYFAFQKLIATAAFIITDSGGIQEETTYRRVPCLTLRPNTERPITITMGSNRLINFDLDELASAIADMDEGRVRRGEVPPLWDGHATERVFDVLAAL